MIYLDNAATSFPKPQCVADALHEAIRQFGNASRGAHDFSLAASRCVERCRRQVAELFACGRADRVAFSKNATEALNVAIASVDGHIVTSEAEHNSVLRPLFRRGNFSAAPVDEYGGYTVGNIRSACRPDTAAVVLAHASNVTGNLAPIAEIGRFCRGRGMLLIVDAAQTAGLVTIDMERMGIDALCFTGHKSLYGPQGTGGICLGNRFAPRPLLVGGSGSHTFSLEQPPEMPDLLEAGTVNAHGLAGLLAGVAYVREHGPAALLAKANRLATRLYRGLRNVASVSCYGDFSVDERLPILTINIGDLQSSEVAGELAETYGIAVRAGAHCAPLLHRRFGTVEQGAVRFSFSHFNTEADADAALRAVEAISRRRS